MDKLTQEEKSMTVRGNWIVRCDIECPVCGNDIDFMDEDEWHTFSHAGETKDFSEPYDIVCPHCKSQLKMTGTDY